MSRIPTGLHELVFDDGESIHHGADERFGGAHLQPHAEAPAKTLVLRRSPEVDAGLARAHRLVSGRYFAARKRFPRLAGVCLEVGLDAEGNFTAWRSGLGWAGSCGDPDARRVEGLGPAAAMPAYRLPAVQLEVRVPPEDGQREAEQLLEAAPHLFAIESLVDEAALALHEDPIGFRLRQLDDPRLRAALTEVREQSGWGRDARTGLGAACAAVGDARAAAVVEVSLSPSAQVRLDGAWFAIDAGGSEAPARLKVALAGPAIANAVFDLCGARVRHLPIRPADVMRALP